MAQASRRFSQNVGKAFNGLQDLGFSPTQRVAVFGRKISRTAEVAGALQLLRSKAVPEVGERAALIIEIASKLELIFKHKKLMRAWLKETQVHLCNKTPRELMISGKFADLQSVASLVRRVTG